MLPSFPTAAQRLSGDGPFVVKNTFIDVREGACVLHMAARKRSASADAAVKPRQGVEQHKDEMKPTPAAAGGVAAAPGGQDALPLTQAVEGRALLPAQVGGSGHARSKSVDFTDTCLLEMRDVDLHEGSALRLGLAIRVLRRSCTACVIQDAPCKLDVHQPSPGELLEKLRELLANIALQGEDRQMLLDLVVVAASLGNSKALPCAAAYAVMIHLWRLWTRCSKVLRRLIEILQQMVMDATTHDVADVEGIISIIICTEEIREFIPDAGRVSYTAALRVLRDIATARCVRAVGHQDRNAYLQLLGQATEGLPVLLKDHILEKMMNSFEKMVGRHESGSFRSLNKVHAKTNRKRAPKGQTQTSCHHAFKVTTPLPVGP